MKSEFLLAFNEITEMRKLPKEVILEALHAALVSAYRRNTGVGSAQHVEARIDDASGEMTLWAEKEVVEEVQNELTEVSLAEARRFDPEAQIDDMVLVDSTPAQFGRIAAQTAKQVILQRMREAEREAQYQEYLERLGDLVTGTVQSDSGGTITIGLGRTEAILPRSQQVPGERYKMHTKVRAYVMEVRKTNRGPQIVVSRAHRNMLRRLLEYEVPEIYNGAVEIKNIAREPGARSKVAVAAVQEGVDPVGACVGMRGMRIQNIVKELNDEKIDVIEWNPDQAVFIAKALSPARVSGVFLDDDPDEGRTAIVVVPDDQLSLAIGREGQNARLAAKLTGWRIDIKSITEAAQEALQHIETPELADLQAEHGEQMTEVIHIMEKKATNRPIMPEDYHLLVDFIEMVESYRLGLRETAYSQRRAELEEARARVPEAAYGFPLEETDLPLPIYTVLSEAGYQMAGQVLEQLYTKPYTLLNLSGLDTTALKLIEDTIVSTDFTTVATEAEVAAASEVEASADAVPAKIEEASEPAEDVLGEPAAETVVDRLTLTEEGPVTDKGAESLRRAERAALVAQLRATPVAGSELPAEQESPPEEAIEELQPTQEELEQTISDTFLADELDDIDLDDLDETEVRAIQAARDKRDKQRRRQLVFDEELGEIVSKRRRKPGRRREDWEDYLD